MSIHDHSSPDSHTPDGFEKGHMPAFVACPKPANENYRYYSADISDFSPRDRFEAWRQTAFQTVDLQRPAEKSKEFQGKTSWVNGVSGSFRSYAGSAHQTRARRHYDWHDGVMVLMLLEEGTVDFQSRTGGWLHMEAGSLGLFDCMRLERFRWSDSREIHLMLPRALVATAFGRDPGHFSDAISLNSAALSPFLQAQMIALHQCAGTLDKESLASMLNLTIDMALMLLGTMSAHGHLDRDKSPSICYASAIRFIEANYHQPGLDADIIAQALGVSRAKLYRLFAGQQATVGAVLRDIRLDRARRLIENSGPGANIGALAYACGFADHSAFGKLFRSRYGVSPSEWRLSWLASRTRAEPSLTAAGQASAANTAQRHAAGGVVWRNGGAVGESLRGRRS